MTDGMKIDGLESRLNLHIHEVYKKIKEVKKNLESWLLQRIDARWGALQERVALLEERVKALEGVRDNTQLLSL